MVVRQDLIGAWISGVYLSYSPLNPGYKAKPTERCVSRPVPFPFSFPPAAMPAPPSSSSPPTTTNPSRLTARGTAHHSPHHSLSGVSAAKASLNRSSATGLSRRPTLSSIPPEDRAKSVSLKAEYDSLLAAAEERESEAARDALVWKTRAGELAEQISRIESDLARLSETDDRLVKLEKELEKTKALAKDHELQLIQQVCTFLFAYLSRVFFSITDHISRTRTRNSTQLVRLGSKLKPS